VTGHSVVAGVLVRDDRVLLGHRSPSRRWYPDVWDFPGGHVEPGEDEAAALARELREEVGVTPREAEPVLTVHDGDVHLVLYAVHAWDGDPRDLQPHEHDELRWFPAAEVHGLRLAHPSYAGLVLRLLGPGTARDRAAAD
jgi:mutator protein MutT